MINEYLSQEQEQREVKVKNIQIKQTKVKRSSIIELEPPIGKTEGFPFRLLSSPLWYKRYTISQSLRPRQTAITGLFV